MYILSVVLLKHCWMAEHNQLLHWTASVYDNLLWIAFRSHYQAVCHHSLSSSDQNEISGLGRFSILDKQKQYDDAVNTSPSVGRAVSASACEREMMPYGVFFTDKTLFSCRLLPIWLTQWDIWLIRVWPTLFWYFSLCNTLKPKSCVVVVIIMIKATPQYRICHFVFCKLCWIHFHKTGTQTYRNFYKIHLKLPLKIIHVNSKYMCGLVTQLCNKPSFIRVIVQF